MAQVYAGKLLRVYLADSGLMLDHYCRLRGWDAEGRPAGAAGPERG
jgi:hypothetical protein